jgi:branched-chain amino acid transport system substrate-binding protein
VVGYTTIKAIAEGVKRAKSTDSERLIVAFKGLSLDMPFGKITFRAEDHQSTMGAYVGKIKNDTGKGVMVDYKYMDGARFQPTADELKKLRAPD